VQLITHYSAYQHVNRDRLFFEGFYITVINICDEAFAALHRRPDIEMKLGNIFRGRHFNLYARINQAPRSVDTLTIKELYAIKHETSNRALNAKLLSALNAKPAALRMSAAAVGHSPLIGEFITSVITARALVKDPELRCEKRAPLITGHIIFQINFPGEKVIFRTKLCLTEKELRQPLLGPSLSAGVAVADLSTQIWAELLVGDWLFHLCSAMVPKAGAASFRPSMASTVRRWQCMR
jgi:hypothetical protein